MRSALAHRQSVSSWGVVGRPTRHGTLRPNLLVLLRVDHPARRETSAARCEQSFSQIGKAVGLHPGLPCFTRFQPLRKRPIGGLGVNRRFHCKPDMSDLDLSVSGEIRHVEEVALTAGPQVGAVYQKLSIPPADSSLPGSFNDPFERVSYELHGRGVSPAPDVIMIAPRCHRRQTDSRALLYT
jgi:hypothetical protein